MSVTKVVSFQSGMETPFNNPFPKSSDATEKAPLPSMQRFRQALQDPVPAETLIGQLRDIIAGPQARLSEVRFEEMLDILEEQKDAGDLRMDVLEDHLGEAVQNVSRMTGLLEDQQDDITDLSRRLEDQVRDLRERHETAIDKLRTDLEASMETMAATLKKCMADIEMNLRGDLLDLSGSFVVHVAEEDKRWERERQSSMLTLEQRIAQWRAEIEDDRNEDMGKLATSMMDIGERLMAMRKNAR